MHIKPNNHGDGFCYGDGYGSGSGSGYGSGYGYGSGDGDGSGYGRLGPWRSTLPPEVLALATVAGVLDDTVPTRWTR